MSAIALAVVAIAVLSPLTAESKIDVRFGILASAGDGTTQFIETSRVPNVVGQSYGWIARIEPRAESVVWFEELKLPRPARVWGVAAGDPNVAVSESRTIAQTRGTVSPGETDFANFWSVAPGDPNGRYIVVLKVSDSTVAEFTFEVVGDQ